MKKVDTSINVLTNSFSKLSSAFWIWRSKCSLEYSFWCKIY